MATALVPYNRFAHALQDGQVHKSTFDAPSRPDPPFATFQHPEKAITFHNIADGNLLQVAAPSTDGAPDMTMQVKQTGRNEFRATYTPDGYAYRVMASYGGKPMQGFPVTMAAETAHLVNDIPGRKFTVHNVYQPHLLAVHTSTLPHKATYNKKANTVTVKYRPEALPGFHEVHVQYKGEDLKKNSRFRLAPKPRMVAGGPVMYQNQAYMGGYPMVAAPMQYGQPMQGAPMQYAQPMQAAPMQYAQPMQTAPGPHLMQAAPMQYAQPMQTAPTAHLMQAAPTAHLMQAGAPMMQGGPALMAQQPMQATAMPAGYAPMMMPTAAQPAGYYAPYPKLK